MHRIGTGTQLLLLALALPTAATSSEGVREINQTVVDHGLEPCDSTPGFPCVIDEPGSYELTGNLVNSATTSPYPDSIAIVADNVALDLNGYAIIGPNECSWLETTSTVSCTIDDATSGSGVVSSNRRVTVRNGAIRSSAYFGVNLREVSRAQDLMISQAGHVGIHVSTSSLIRRCTVELTRSSLLSTAAGAVVANNSVGRGLGPMVYNGSLVAEIEVVDSASQGLWVHPGTLVHDAHIYQAASDCIEYSPFAEPIDTGGLVVRTTAAQCGASGLKIDTDCISGLASVTIMSSSAATSGDAIQLGANLCNGNTTCP